MKRTRTDRQAEKVAYMQQIGWFFDSRTGRDIEMVMGNRRCIVDKNGKTREISDWQTSQR